LVAAGERFSPSFGFSPEAQGSDRPKIGDLSSRSSSEGVQARNPDRPPGPERFAETDFCGGLRKLLEASSDGFRSVTQGFKESQSGVLVGRGTVELPGAVLCTAVQHLVSGAWKASYTCHFAGDDETVPRAEANRRFEALKQKTRGCVPQDLKERDNTGGEDLGVVSTSFSGVASGPVVTVFLNYNGGSAEHPSTIDLWLSVARSIPAGPAVSRLGGVPPVARRGAIRSA
jgi:hypothetical protein